jgi:glycosyltransferase involved in cell wall biosynthesis
MDYSVVIPAFNAEATIAEAIESVVRQTVPPAEIVVVDDGSTDRTAEIARSCDPRVWLVSRENGGAGAAMTTAMRHLSLPIFASLDADDLWLPDKMAKQLAHLAENPSCDFVFSHWRTFRSDGGTAGVDVASPGWSRTTMATRTERALAIGDVVDPPGGRGEMIDWLARGRHLGLRMDMLEVVHAMRRIRPGSLSYGRSSERDKGYARVARLALQRRKGVVA